MTDLEINNLCAKAFYGKAVRSDVGGKLYVEPWDSEEIILYDPLHDDAQAMELVKKFNLRLDRTRSIPEKWGVYSSGYFHNMQIGDDLNRLICLCVANLQEPK